MTVEEHPSYDQPIDGGAGQSIVAGSELRPAAFPYARPKNIRGGASVAHSPQQHLNDCCSNDCLTEGRAMTSRILLIRRVATLVLASTGAVAGSVSWAEDAPVPPSLPEVIVTA